NYTTVPQPGLNGASIAYPRGHVLGGSSSVSELARYTNVSATRNSSRSMDCLVYTRGSKADFDRYANVTGDSGWSWDSILPYFKKSERFTPSADRHNTTGQFDPSFHGFSGLNSVSLPGAPTVIDDPVNSAIGQLAGEFASNTHTNSGNPLGFGKFGYHLHEPFLISVVIRMVTGSY
ncbi:hypothetical protein BDZ97DRAFT_1659542, partial [Flammula alnicola]